MVGRYQPYPAYTPSDVEWLGDIPVGWNVAAIKHSVSTPVTDGPHETPNFIDEGIPFVSAEAVSSGQIDFTKIRSHISQRDHDRYSQKYAPEFGDIFLVKSGATTGKTAIVETDETFNIWSPLAAIRCKPDMVPRFVLHFMRSAQFQEAIRLYWSFGTQQNIGMKVIENLRTTVPSVAEQTQIAAFLDHETAKIDALIAKQQRLIELLEEKRQAVISHAVTKGLNPDAPLRPSGIDWLGDIPVGWKPSRLKHQAWKIVDGAHFTPTYVDAGVPFLRVTDIHTGVIDQNTIKFIPKSEHQNLKERCNPEKGDLLLSKNGTIGVPLVVNWDWEFSIFVSLCLIKLKPSCSPNFAYYFFLSHQVREQIFGLIKQSTVINLHLDKIEKFVFALPPIEEQTQIAAFLDHKTAKVDKLIAKATVAANLLKERRTALISAAVTGKIDVRDWTPPEAKDEAA